LEKGVNHTSEGSYSRLNKALAEEITNLGWIMAPMAALLPLLDMDYKEPSAVKGKAFLTSLSSFIIKH
jgi:hypothetical protein